MTKICTKCGCEKPLTEFHFRKDSGKHRSACKTCRRDEEQKTYRGNPEKFRARKQKEYADSPEKFRARKNQEYAANPKKFLAQKHAELLRSQAKVKASWRAWYEKNPAWLFTLIKSWLSRKELEKRNRKISNILRSRILMALDGKIKSATSFELLGCTIEEFIVYIEKQFKPGMTWDTHSVRGWHIDHIRPCADFSDLSDPSQQRACFHFSNQQPLWAVDNWSKHKTHAS